MKFKLLISTIFISTSVLSAAEVDEDPGSSQYIGDLATVFTSKLVRTESDFVVYETDNPLSHAFSPNSNVVLNRWRKATRFLLETLGAGLGYAESLKNDASGQTVEMMRATNPLFLKGLLDFAIEINTRLNLERDSFLPEEPLNKLYQYIMSAIDEIEQGGRSEYYFFIVSFYIPIFDWMKSNFPLTQMYDYVVPSVITTYEEATIPGSEVMSAYVFALSKYLSDLYETHQYKKITLFLRNRPEEREIFLFERQCLIQSTNLGSAGDANSDINLEMRFVRSLEGIQQRTKEFIEKWMSKIHEEEASLSERARKAEAAERARKARDPKKIEAEMLRAMGLDDNPKKPKFAQLDDNPEFAQASQSKKAKTQSKGTEGKKASQPIKPIPAGDSLNETAPVALAAVAPESHRISEEEILANLAATKEHNATRNAALQARQAMLAERKAEKAENESIVRTALVKRQESWLDRAFNAKLSSFDSERQILLSELNSNPDFDAVCEKLRSVGGYVDTNIHGNEKGVARWVGADGKSVMVWFDRPHGAQLEMGVSAGWFKGLVKRLRETGMLSE